MDEWISPCERDNPLDADARTPGRLEGGGTIMAKMPDGYHEIKNVTGVYIKDHRIVVCGTPDEDDDVHNCDDMGCGSINHVLFRGCCCHLSKVGFKKRQEE